MGVWMKRSFAERRSPGLRTGRSQKERDLILGMTCARRGITIGLIIRLKESQIKGRVIYT